MEILDFCLDAYNQGDWSTCKPLGFSLLEWLGVFGISIASLFKGFRAFVVRSGHRLLALVIRKPTIVDPLLAEPAREVLGRDADIERIEQAFKDRGKLSAVAITGAGGFGKTALAGEYARRRAQRYRGPSATSSRGARVLYNGASCCA